MTNAYNDVQASKVGLALGDVESETPDGEFDLASWSALQKTVSLNPDFGTEQLVSTSDKAVDHLKSVSAAVAKLSQTQAVANVHLLSDNFIRDSITGK